MNETAQMIHPEENQTFYLGYTKEELREKLAFEPQQWSEEATSISRLLITGSLYKKDGHYFFTRNGKTRQLEGVTTTFGAYLYFLADEMNRRKLHAYYEEAWNSSFIISLIKNETVALDYYDKAKAAKEMIFQEMKSFRISSLDQEDFAICPFRTSLLLAHLLDRDMSSMLP